MVDRSIAMKKAFSDGHKRFSRKLGAVKVATNKEGKKKNSTNSEDQEL